MRPYDTPELLLSMTSMGPDNPKTMGQPPYGCNATKALPSPRCDFTAVCTNLEHLKNLL